MLYQEKVSAAFAGKVDDIAGRLGIAPDWLMAVMHFETGGTFNPAAKNPNSSATGLIQFMAPTAASLGTSTAALAQMSAVDQLDYVEDYLTPYKGKMDSLVNTYLAVFFPAAINKPMSYQFPAWVASANPVFVRNGVVTKQGIADTLTSRYGNATGGSSKKKALTTVAIVSSVLLLVLLFVAWWYYKKRS